MATYDIDFSDTLISAAISIEKSSIDSFNAIRTIIYLTSLSMEIALKSLLEQAGVPVSTIKSRSHNFVKLMADICFCEMETDVGNGHMLWMSASNLRTLVIREGERTISLWGLLCDSDIPKSKYPNEIRYGEELTHFLPSTMIQASSMLVSIIKEHQGRIRLMQGKEIK